MSGHTGLHAPQPVEVCVMGKEHWIETCRSEHSHVGKAREVLWIRSPKMTSPCGPPRVVPICRGLRRRKAPRCALPPKSAKDFDPSIAFMTVGPTLAIGILSFGPTARVVSNKVATLMARLSSALRNVEAP
jgi:hypothetical protein